MRNRARVALAAAAVTVTGPLIVGAATSASAATLRGCPTATGQQSARTPPTFTKTVALTFDDGPSVTWTPQVLAVLAKHRVHATFFVVGRRAEANPEVLQQIVDAGHVVGNHTWDHPTSGAGMYGLTPQQLATEMDPTTALIKNATGLPVCFFRAPQGKDRTSTIRTMAKDRGQTVTGFYTASDYLQPGHLDPGWVAQIAQRLENQGSHPVLLLHDSGTYRGNSVKALDEVITWYASRGYVFTDPAGRPFPGELPRGAKLPATGWAVPPGHTPPDSSLAGTPARPTDLPTFPADDATATPSMTPSSTGDGAPTGTPTPATPESDGSTPADRTRAWNKRMATLAANSKQDPLAARQLTDAVTRYLMLFSAPPA